MLKSILVCLAAVGCMTPALAQTPASTIKPSDKTFLVNDAKGGAFELASAKLAQEKATRPDVKNYAQKLVGDHETYNAALEKLGQNKGITLPTEMDPADRTRMTKLEKLSGPAFDKAYVADAVRINADDKREAEKEKRTTKDDDIKQFIQQFASMDAEHQTLAKQLSAAKR